MLGGDRKGKKEKKKKEKKRKKMKEMEKREKGKSFFLVLVLSTGREQKKKRGVRSSTFSLRSKGDRAVGFLLEQ